MTTKPDYAGLSRSLGALAYHIQQTRTADSKDAQTCLEVADALRALLERNAVLERECDELKHDVSRYVEIASEEATRAEAAEAKLAEAMKVIEPFASMPIIGAVPDAPDRTWVSVPIGWVRAARALKENGGRNAE